MYCPGVLYSFYMGSSACEPCLAQVFLLVSAMTLLCGRSTHGVSGYDKLSRRDKDPHPLGASCNQRMCHREKDRQPLAAQQAVQSLRCTEQLRSVGLGADFAELESSDEHVDASISPSPGVAEEVAEQRQNERRDSSSEFPTNLQRPPSWWLRLLATLALLAFSLQWLHSQLGQDSQDYFYEIGVFADASVAKGEAVNHRTASTLRVVIFTAL